MKLGFNAGILSGLSADWTGKGPSFKQYYIIPENLDEMKKQNIFYNFGQFVGFFILMSLIILTLYMAYIGIDQYICMIPVLMNLILMIGSSLIIVKYGIKNPSKDFF